MSFCSSAYYSRGFLAAVIELDFHGSCNSTASFDYLIFTSDDTGLSNCTVHYGIQERYSSVRLANDKWYKYLNKSGTIKVGQLLEGLNYTLQVTCGDVSSRSIDFSADSEYKKHILLSCFMYHIFLVICNWSHLHFPILIIFVKRHFIKAV